MDRRNRNSKPREIHHMTRTVQGTMHGATIELAEDVGLSDGQAVEVIIRPLAAPPTWGEGIRRSAGAAADMPEWDEAMAEVARDRDISYSRTAPQ
jgi:hypothetical protein